MYITTNTTKPICLNFAVLYLGYYDVYNHKHSKNKKDRYVVGNSADKHTNLIAWKT